MSEKTELPVREDRCETCRFWEHELYTSETLGGEPTVQHIGYPGNVDGYVRAGECRIRAPRLHVADEADPWPERFLAYWPIVLTHDWCGEWQPRRATTPPSPPEIPGWIYRGPKDLEDKDGFQWWHQNVLYPSFEVVEKHLRQLVPRKNWPKVSMYPHDMTRASHAVVRTLIAGDEYNKIMPTARYPLTTFDPLTFPWDDLPAKEKSRAYFARLMQALASLKATPTSP